MALNVFEIPLSGNAQRFDIVLSDVDYFMQFVWNSIANCWVLDISDLNSNPIVQGIPLITGADLLAQFQSLGFTGGLICTTDDGVGIPTYAGLGSTGHLYFVTN